MSSERVVEMMLATDKARRALRAWAVGQPRDQLPWHLNGIGAFGFNMVDVPLRPPSDRPESPDRRGISKAYEALNVAIKAGRAALEDGAGRFSLVAVFPLIVVDGPLYSLAYGDDGEEDLGPVDWERLIWSGALGGAPVVVDVVRRPYLERYADRAEGSIRHLLSYLGEP